MTTRAWPLIAAAIAALAAGARQVPPTAPDLIVRRGLVVDGTGAAGRIADVAVAGGRIVRIGRLDGMRARDEIDALGLVVAPGFIDVHTHADDIASAPGADTFVRMGVTTIVAGNCGASAVDVDTALDRVAAVGPAVNFATLVGHNAVRRHVMGDAGRPPSPDELNRMKALVWRAMVDGAIGFSTGLQYAPGIFAGAPEILALARVAGDAGGLYASHLRNEGTDIESSIAEAIAIGEGAGCPVQISHLKIDSPSRWGAGPEVLRLIDRARERGVDVAADQYPYTAAASSLAIRLPDWAREGGQARLVERLDDETTWERMRAEMVALIRERGFEDYGFAVVAAYRPDPSYEGQSIEELARRITGRADLDAQLDLIRTMMREGGASMVYHLMAEDDVAAIARHPFVAFASDASVTEANAGRPHPRAYGNTARVLAWYVREQRILRLEEAVRRMTSLPAERFRLAGRGAIREEYAADLVVFDPSRILDTATFTDPRRHPEGIPHVIVNGVPVVRQGRLTGARAGQVLRGTGAVKVRGEG